MKKSARLMAAFLTLALTVPGIAACSKENSSSGEVFTDEPWYNTTEVAIGTEFDYSRCRQPSFDYKGKYGDNLVFRVTGYLPLPEEELSFKEGLDYRIDDLRVYDLSGNLVSMVDCIDLLRALPDDVDGGYIESINIEDDGCSVEVTGFISDPGTDYTYISTIDLGSGETGELVETEAAAQDSYIARLEQDGGFREDMSEACGRQIDPFWFNDNGYSYVFEIKDADGSITELDFRQLYPTVNIIYANYFLEIGEDEALLIAGCEGGTTKFFEINFADGSVTDVSDQMGFLTGKTDFLTTIEGYGTVVRDINGIYTIDYAARTLNPAFLYSYANINMYELNYMTPISIEEDVTLFAGTKYNISPFDNPQTVLYIFEKADSNPNAGKTILEVASADDYSYGLCDAVCRFNDTNSECYIKLNTSYNVDDAVSNMSGESGDEAGDQDIAATELGNQLAIDIMSGTGPDIIVNGEEFVMLNNDNYLLDMTEYVNTTFTSDRYFTNFFEAASDDGKLYHVPVTCSAMGIATDRSNVEPGQVGFTYEQYEQFVYDTCNGSDPITGGRMYFFINSLNSMTDLLIIDGVVDYDCEAFRTLAEYTSEFVNEPLVSDDEDDYVFVDETTLAAKFVTINGVQSYFDSVLNGDKVLLGMPSYDGRGPVLVGSDSVAISAMTSAPDACKEFVSILLGNEVQADMGFHNGIPVNREAFVSACNMLIDYQHHMLSEMSNYMSEADIRSYGMNPNQMDESVIGDFESFVEGLAGWYDNDASINAIIREEMPAYFEGQKSLDQVIPVLEERIQTFLDERG